MVFGALKRLSLCKKRPFFCVAPDILLIPCLKMSQTTAEVTPVVENCISSDGSSIGDQLHPSSGKNGLVNGLVHPKKSRRNRRNKGGEKSAEDFVEKEDPKVNNNNHCTNNIGNDIDHNILKPEEEKGIENNQSPNIVNIVNNLKVNDQQQEIVDLDCNHKLDKTNSEFSTADNHYSKDLSPIKKSLSEEHKSPSKINLNNSVSDLSKEIKHLDLDKKFEEESNCDKKIDFVQYESELQMPMIMKIIQKDLSEPYSIYTYRYFIHNWPKLCFLAMCEDQCVGAIVCKLDVHRKVIRRGYIAMLAVDQNYRKLKIGSTLVQMAIHEMTMGDADEVVLETEVTNKPALKLYEKLGFVRDKRLFRYYLNGVDALRLKLWLR